MAKKTGSQSKSALIRDYLVNNPAHTWKDAEATLEKHGINSSYFGMIKSQTKAKSKKRKTSKPAAKKGSSKLEVAKSFAREIGSIDGAMDALKELQKYQV